MHCNRDLDASPTRREMLLRCANGFGAVALAGAAAATRRSAASSATAPEETGPLAPRPPHFPAKARSVIFLYMDGGPSQVDTFDPKPLLDREHGQPIRMKRRADAVQQRRQRAASRPGSSASTARAASRSATCSRTSPRCVDDLAVIRSMVVELLRAHQRQLLPAHRPRACRAGRAWGRGSTYGLGSECQDLPGFVVLNSGLIPPGGLDCFNSGFLPASYQGSRLPARRPRPSPTSSPAEATAELQRSKLGLLRKLDQGVARPHGRATTASSRPSPTTSWPSACRRPCPELMDLAGESAATQALYGLDDDVRADRRSSAASACVARRLVERGVRFVELLCPNVGARPLGPARQPQGRATRTTPAPSTSRSPAC